MQPFANLLILGAILDMSEYKASKQEPSENLESVAEFLSEQPEKVDRDFLKEYFYWSWRCLLFVLFMVFLTSMDFNKPPTQWFDNISATMWAVLILVPLLVGPLIFTGWSYVWMWGQDLVEKIYRRRE
jgi:hypothetical protein